MLKNYTTVIKRFVHNNPMSSSLTQLKNKLTNLKFPSRFRFSFFDRLYTSLYFEKNPFPL